MKCQITFSKTTEKTRLKYQNSTKRKSRVEEKLRNWKKPNGKSKNKYVSRIFKNELKINNSYIIIIIIWLPGLDFIPDIFPRIKKYVIQLLVIFFSNTNIYFTLEYLQNWYVTNYFVYFKRKGNIEIKWKNLAKVNNYGKLLEGGFNF